MPTRSIFLISVFFTVTAVLFGENLEYVTIRRTMLYDNDTSTLDFSRDARFEIDESTKVKYIQRPHLFKGTTRNGVDIVLGTFEYDNTKYYIDCADLIPANTTDTFDPLFISDLNGSDRRIWVPWYYTEVLQSMDRNTVLLLEPYWEKEYDPYWEDPFQDGDGQKWYKMFYDLFPCNEFDITNSVLVLNRYIRFIIKDIKRTNNGYIVTVKFTDEGWVFNKRDSLNWNSIMGKEFFDMILCVDGDYMDVYLDDMEHKLTSFVLVDQVFLNELKALIKDNNADLSKISSWPMRADGSIDYPLPNNTEKEKQPELIELFVDSSDTENQRVAQSSAKTSAIPLWAWFAIIGGAVVIAGGAAVFVVMRSKK